MECAYGESRQWVNLERLVDEIQDPDTDPSDARRYYLNVAAPSSDWEGYEFMKSAGFKVLWQRYPEGSLASVHLPDLVALDPGMVDPKGITFVVSEGRDYLAAEAKKMKVAEIVSYAKYLPMVKEVNEPSLDRWGHVYSGWEKPLSDETLAELVPLAYLFVLYLSNRSRAPIPPDGKFYLQVLLACLQRGLASFSLGDGYGDDRRFGRNKVYQFKEEGLEVGRLAPGIAFKASHEEIEETLAATCASYFKRVEGK